MTGETKGNMLQAQAMLMIEIQSGANTDIPLSVAQQSFYSDISLPARHGAMLITPCIPVFSFSGTICR